MHRVRNTDCGTVVSVHVPRQLRAEPVAPHFRRRISDSLFFSLFSLTHSNLAMNQLDILYQKHVMDPSSSVKNNVPHGVKCSIYYGVSSTILAV
jgi:hypothetical protein